MDSNNKLYSILAYIGPLCFVGLITSPNEQDVKFHVNYGLILFIVEVIISFIFWIPFVGPIIDFVVGIGCLVLAIMGIMNANNGLQKELPIIGKIKILK